MLPIYPLDGGRVMQAFLSYKLSYARCVNVTLWISLALSAALLAASVLPLVYAHPVQFNVGIIALFLLLSNGTMWRQKNYVHMRFLMHCQVDENRRHKPVAPLVVKPGDTMLATVKRLQKEAYHVVLVRDHAGGVVRILPEEWLLRHFFSGFPPHGQLLELLETR